MSSTKFVFWADRKNKMAAWLWLVETFSTSPLKPLKGIQRNLIGSKISMSSTKFVFLGPIGKTIWSLWSLIGWDISTSRSSPLKPLKGIQRNFTGSKISMSSTRFLFFRPIGKTRWPPWPLIGWDIFDFSSETAERNATKLEGSKISTSSDKFVFFGPIIKQKLPSWQIPHKGGTLYSSARYVALWACCSSIHQRKPWRKYEYTNG